MKNIFFVSILCFILVSSVSCPIISLKNRVLYYSEDEVDGQIFSHRIELLEGVQRDIYKIDGNLIEKREEYEDCFLKAERQERQKQRQKEYEEKILEHKFKQDAQHAIMKKLLRSKVVSIQQAVCRLEKYDLEKYFDFGSSAIASQDEYDVLVYDLLPRSTRFLDSETGAGYDDLVEFYKMIELYEDKVKEFVRMTINNAIDQSDDTRVLKDLLGLVS